MVTVAGITTGAFWLRVRKTRPTAFVHALTPTERTNGAEATHRQPLEAKLQSIQTGLTTVLAELAEWGQAVGQRVTTAGLASVGEGEQRWRQLRSHTAPQREKLRQELLTLRTNLASAYNDREAALQVLAANKLALLFGDARRQHIETLTGSQPAVTPAEQAAWRNIMVASANLTLTLGLAWFAPTALLFSVPGLLYLTRPVFQDIYNALVVHRQFTVRLFISLTILGCIAGGFWLAAAWSLWFAMLVRYVGLKVEDHSQKNLSNLFGQQPHRVWIMVDAAEVEVPFAQVQVNDILIVGAGQLIPVDGIVTAGRALVDQHRLTGESQPAEKASGDPVLAATLVQAGKLYIRVEKTGQATVSAQIAQVLADAARYKTTMRARFLEAADRNTIYVVGVAGGALLLQGLSGALALLMNIPGGKVVLLGPLSMMNFLNLAARQNILVKDGRALETLAAVDTVVFDKTGTLTIEEPQVVAIHVCNGLSAAELLRYAAAAEQRQSHPIAKAILTAAAERKLALPPLDYAQVEIGHGLRVTIGGKTVQIGNERFLTEAGLVIPPELRERLATCQAQGHSLVLVALEDAICGAIELRASVRPEARLVAQQLRQAGKTVYIISGDREAPTQQMAQALGIEHYFANTLPADKAQLVKQLQQEGRRVCFVGDGINDAIAMHEADVSVSLCGATTIATDTAQVVLMNSDLRQLLVLFDMAQAMQSNITTLRYLTYAATGICTGMVFVLHWGVLPAVFLSNLTFFAGLGNLLWPMLRQDRLARRLATEGDTSV